MKMKMSELYHLIPIIIIHSVQIPEIGHLCPTLQEKSATLTRKSKARVLLDAQRSKSLHPDRPVVQLPF